MIDTRHKDTLWDCGGPVVETVHHANLAVLMDIRDELKTLNRLFGCHRFVAIPSQLEAIEKNTSKRKYRRKKK